MRNKGLVVFIIVFLSGLGLYYSVFTYMDYKVQSRINEEVIKEKGFLDMNEKQKRIDSIWDKEAYSIFGFIFTYGQIKKKSLCFGLDLQGGMSVIIDVDIDKLLLQMAVKRYKKNIEDILRKIDKKEKDKIEVFIEKISEFLRKGNLSLVDCFWTENCGIKIGEDKVGDVKKYLIERINFVISKTLYIVKIRINKFGTSQPNIQKLSGSRKIQIEIPGVHNPKRVKDLLQGVAKLQFWIEYEREKKERIIDSINSLIKKKEIKDSKNRDIKLNKDMRYNADSAKEIELLFKRNEIVGILPSNIVICSDRGGKTRKVDGDDFVNFYFLETDINGNAPLDGDVITDARPSRDMSGRVIVEIKMNSHGTNVWSVITGQNIGKRVILTLDNRAIIVANISEKIPNGRTCLSGNYTQAEANDLAMMLKSGALPTPVTIVEETIVGPGLSGLAKKQGFNSMLIGLILLLLLMFLIYSKSGLIANIALIFNLFFILTGFAIMNIVLTLTGIAGFILTLAMAIDANVLINERIKEEMEKPGVGIREALRNGYSKASSSIFDSNMTTFLTAVVLFVFGSGAIRGFSVTLIIGIISSFFTAVYISRYFFYIKEQNKTLVNMRFSWFFTKHLFKNVHFDFVKVRFFFYSLSLLMFAFGGYFLYKKGFTYGLDFTGGCNYIVKIDKKIDSVDLKKKLSDVIKENVDVKTYGMDNVFKIMVGFSGVSSNEECLEILKKALGNIFDKDVEKVENNDALLNKEVNKSSTQNADGSFFEIISSEKIETDMVQEIKKNAKHSILLVLIIMFLYILVRFRKWQYGLAAVISLIHDVFGIFAIYGISKYFGYVIDVDLVFIAAILTILGYSINNTVIIFDRIRENIKNNKENRSFYDIINNSINMTLSRTIITSFSTLMVVFVIFIFGGVSLSNFSFVLLTGFAFGAYSSIFISATILKDLIKEK